MMQFDHFHCFKYNRQSSLSLCIARWAFKRQSLSILKFISLLTDYWPGQHEAKETHWLLQLTHGDLMQLEINFIFLFIFACIPIQWEESTQNIGESWSWKKKQWRHWHPRLWQKVKEDLTFNTYSCNILGVEGEIVLTTERFVVPPSWPPIKHTGGRKNAHLLLLWDFITNTEKNQCQ